MHAGRPGRLDQAIRLGDRRGERLLGVERDAGCEDRLVDHAMGWRGSEIDDPVEPAGLEHRVERVERACVGRPARDLPGQRLRCLEARVHDRDDPDASGVRLERGQVVPVGDVTTADDPEPQRRTGVPGTAVKRTEARVVLHDRILPHLAGSPRVIGARPRDNGRAHRSD